jgi:DNA polymerase I-like protein with 3'-5' exonuclease and polymerase domains
VNGLESFEEIWCVDTEYSAPAGHRPTPICLVALELRSGRQLRLGEDQLAQLRAAPFRTDRHAVFVAYAAAAEFSVFHALGWPAPERTLDLFFEFRALTNGLQTPSGSGLLGALVYHALPAMAGAEKEEMRQLAIRGGPFTDAERAALLSYCAEDVAALARLLPAMLPRIDLGRALLRGRYAWAVAAMEHRGIPLDVPTFEHLKSRWSAVQSRLVAEVDQRYHVFEGTTFKRDRFARYLVEREIPWPMLESGQLDLSDDTFRSQAKVHPVVAELRELRAALGQMRLFEDLAIGPDGRNRTSIAPFRARTGRNQPSNAKFIFGPSRWLRSLIRPEPGMAVAYLDFISQEIAVGAALSGDAAMLEAYSSGDFYLAFARQAGAVPADATKATHGEARSLFKAAALAVMYGMGPESLAQKIGKPTAAAAELLTLHRRTYPQFWKWSQAAVDRATLTGQIRTVFGWPLRVGPSMDPTRPAANPRALSNFPVQGNAAEMLRLACCLLVERGIGLCAPVHDAVMVEGPVDQIEEVVDQTRAAMTEASRVVLRGFEIGADVKIVSWPDRYVDDAGAAFWETVLRLAAPAPEIATPDDVVHHNGRSTSSQRPNRSGLLRESSKGVSFSSIDRGGA